MRGVSVSRVTFPLAWTPQKGMYRDLAQREKVSISLWCTSCHYVLQQPQSTRPARTDVSKSHINLHFVDFVLYEATNGNTFLFDPEAGRFYVKWNLDELFPILFPCLLCIQTGRPNSILFSITASLKLPYKNLSSLDNGQWRFYFNATNNLLKMS